MTRAMIIMKTITDSKLVAVSTLASNNGKVSDSPHTPSPLVSANGDIVSSSDTGAVGCIDAELAASTGLAQ